MSRIRVNYARVHCLSKQCHERASRCYVSFDTSHAFRSTVPWLWTRDVTVNEQCSSHVRIIDPVCRRADSIVLSDAARQMSEQSLAPVLFSFSLSLSRRNVHKLLEQDTFEVRLESSSKMIQVQLTVKEIERNDQ